MNRVFDAYFYVIRNENVKPTTLCMRCASLDELCFAPIRNESEVELAEDTSHSQSDRLIRVVFRLHGSRKSQPAGELR